MKYPESPSWTADGKQLMYLSQMNRTADVVISQVSAVPCNLEWKQKKNHETGHAGQVLDGVSSGYRNHMISVIVDNRIVGNCSITNRDDPARWLMRLNTVIPGFAEMHDASERHGW